MKTFAFILLLCFSVGFSVGAIENKKVPEKKIELLIKLKSDVRNNLINNILPYWTKNMADPVNGGFYGRIDGQEKKYPEAEKGGILNGRILWTYSAAYRVTKDTSYLSMAKRAKDYILTYFIDKEYGGTYRSVTFKGEPSDTRKQTYSQSFLMYGLSEYARATGNQKALEAAKAIYFALEKHAKDPVSEGYFEVFDQKWQRTTDLIIGEKSAKDEKTMNTHLHLMESYASLYRVWHDPGLAGRLRNLILLFRDQIINQKTYHLNVFLDRSWHSTSTIHSYGHDIETSWLIVEAAQILGDQQLVKECEKLAIKIVVASSEGLQTDGSLIAEKDYADGKTNTTRDWWPQAETVVGLLNAYELSGEDHYLTDAIRCWNFTNKYLVDHKFGEWYGSVSAAGTVGKGDKAGFWKCPYHNGRMCLEVMERVSKLTEAKK